jgi:IclR family pca regulon transcriptional regulator
MGIMHSETLPLDARAVIGAFSGDPDFMASLARGLAVIRAFHDQPQRMTIAELSRRTGIPRAAVRRCLYTLTQLGYVAAAERSFVLTAKMLSLGHAYLSSTPLVVAAQPLLDRVTAELRESSSLSILDADAVLYIARSATQRIMSVALQVGSRLPAYCTSMGQVLLAHLPASALDAYLLRNPLVAHTPHTITSRPKLQKLLTAVRQNGFAVVDQQLEIGLRSVAVPVRDSSGSVVAAINASAQSSRISLQELEERFLPVLRSTSEDLGHLL